MTDQKKTEEELRGAVEVALRCYGWGPMDDAETERGKQAIRAFIDHLKSTRRERERRAFTDGVEAGYLSGRISKESMGQCKARAVREWEAEQEKGK